MAASPKSSQLGLTRKVELNVFVGREELPVGTLVYVKAGQREFSQFA